MTGALLRRYLKKYRDHDDIDSIAHQMGIDLRAAARLDRDGVLSVIEHPAALEMDAAPGVVLYPELIDELAAPAHGALRDGLWEELRERLTASEPGIRQRARYALARLLGPESPEAIDGLSSGQAADEAAVLGALARTTGPLPERLHAPLEKLLRDGRGKGPGADAFFLFDAPLVSAVLRLPRADALLSVLLEDVDLRAQLGRALDRAQGAFAVAPSPALRARFTAAADRIEKPPAGTLPSRNEIAIAATIARLTPEDPEILERAAVLLDALVALARSLGAIKKQALDEGTKALVDTLDHGVGRLSPPARARLARHLVGDWTPLFGLGARAWATLDLEAARALHAEHGRGDGAHVPLRREAMAAALASAKAPRSDLAALLTEGKGALVLTPNLGAALARSTVDPTQIADLVRRARSVPDLRAAIELAASQKAKDQLRPILVRLREGPYRIDAALEALLEPLVDDDNEAWLEAEIEGENPFRDRQQALARVLAKRRR